MIESAPTPTSEILRVNLTPTVVERFWSKVDKTEECWEWKAATSRGGYGSFSVPLDGLRYKHIGAHRISYFVANGYLPAELSVCHRCDNPGCVRPDHLFAGTTADNHRDMTEKGRGVIGDKNGSRTHPERRRRGASNHLSKLTTEQVLEMRALYAQGGVTVRGLAARFGILRRQAGLILSRQSWAHI